MATFRLEIKTDNSVFGNKPELELSRILDELADEVAEDPRESFSIRDENGNTVGKATWN
jgi:hypothetical protein